MTLMLKLRFTGKSRLDIFILLHKIVEDKELPETCMVEAGIFPGHQKEFWSIVYVWLLREIADPFR
jgi:hypothetical protein